ncbi:MAG: lectin like domain-containing protein [Eubacterium sp.]
MKQSIYKLIIDHMIILFAILLLTIFFSTWHVNAEIMPQQYDLRNVNGINYVTSVKNQTDYGDCWSFSAAAAMESNLLKQGYGVQDLSELELGYYASHTAKPSRPGIENDKTVLVDYFDGTYLDAGGLTHYVTQLMANGYGITTEDILPHPLSGNPPRSIDNLITYNDNKYTIKNVDWVSMKNKEDIKRHIMSCGAGDAGFDIYLNSSGDPDYYWNTDTNSYYLSPSGYAIANRMGNMGGHAVAIVGWDDNYSRSRFGGKRKVLPDQDGAWLCKNSWGTGEKYCEDGYFWISYEDASMKNSSVAFYTMTPASPSNQNIYQYDGSLSDAVVKTSSRKASAANIFKTRKTEQLNAVGFLQSSSNLSYSVQIYRNPKKGNPTQGKKMLKNPLRGTFKTAGYHIVSFPQKLRLKKGQRFSVVVTFQSAGGSSFTIPVDKSMSIPYDESRNYIEYISNSKLGQSYLKTGTKWKDISKNRHCNARVKVYAD